MRSVPLRISGRIYGRGHRGTIVIQGWPRKRPQQANHPVTAAQNAGFIRMVRAVQQMMAVDIESAKLIAPRSGYTYKDVLSRAVVGRLFQLASDNLESVLDALNEISKVAGSMLYCNGTGWMAVIPEFANTSPTVDEIGIITFKQLFEYLAPSEGDMLTYHDGDWKIIDRGGAAQLLTWDPVTDLPIWKDQSASPNYTIGCFVPGTLADAQTLLIHKFAKAVTTPADFGAYLGRVSEAGVTSAPIADCDITVSRALAASPTAFSTVGQIFFAAGAADASFTTLGATPISWAQGDVLRLQGPTPADAALADFAATLVGAET